MKIALVHDYLREYGGAERVVEALHEIWPEAPLYTSFVDWNGLGEHAYRFRDWDIRTSWVQHNPFVKKFISPLRFLAPKIWSSFDLSSYDVVLSSSGWFMCRGVALQSKWSMVPGKWPKGKYFYDSQIEPSTINHQQSTKQPLHICYIHHPPRNLYGYATGSDLQKYALVRVYAAIVNFYLRHYDYETAQKVDFFIANSKETARRVEKFYRRDSTVIYPPIEVHGSSFMVHSKIERSYYLSVGRLTWSKRVDLAIQACNDLKLPLKIVGTGKEESYLKSIAGSTVEFVGSVSDAELSRLYTGAKALIFCAQDEDFGMVPVEAMAHGTPVVGLGQGGVLETVIDGTHSASFGKTQDKGSGRETGILFDKPDIESLKTAIGKFEKRSEKMIEEMRKNCLKQAEKFGKERFKKEIINFVVRHIEK